MIEEYQTKEYWEKRTQMYKNDPQSLLFRDPRFEEYEKRTREELVKWHNLKVLDIACGYGRFAELFDDYFGVDFSEEMLKLAFEKNAGKYFECQDIKNWVPENNFDVIFEVNSLHCLDMTPEQFFERYKKFAKVAIACLEADHFAVFQIY